MTEDLLALLALEDAMERGLHQLLVAAVAGW
jgi:hypothetical protein